LEQEKLHSIALTCMTNFSLSTLRQLHERLGSATAIVEHRNNIGDVMPDMHPRLVEALKDMDEPMKRAEKELEFAQRYNILPLCLNDDRYPQRMKQCPDAPLVLFYRGSADLNAHHVINIIGTRHCTPYGQELIHRFCIDLRQLCPDVLIVSGLAYGIDICAHRNALANGFDTVGVLAHGLDDLYPARHKETARRMVTQGGLLTEYTTQTQPLPQNFIQRNRIVAGMSDACILVESAKKGGGLITAGIARSYNRDVFAFPGPVGAAASEGCNNLIRDNGAALITSARDLVLAMGWQAEAQVRQAKAQGIERDMFPQLTDEERCIVDVLQQNNDLQMNILVVKTGIPVASLTAILFEMEMKGIVKTMAGGVYHLLTI
jgi:DNA processing protein